MSRALIIGGTRGLGRALAIELLRSGVQPIVTGRSIDDAAKDPALKDARCIWLDITQRLGFVGVMQDLERNVANIDYVFYVAGNHLLDDLIEVDLGEARELFELHVIGWLRCLQAFHPLKHEPYTVVTVASTTAWKIRSSGETVYGAAKAAQAKLAADFHNELTRDFPDARSLIVYPGGMNTDLLKESGKDVSSWMDPALVAEHIWVQAQQQAAASLVHMQIERSSEGKPLVSFGPRVIQ